jgi:transcriptional regulator with XRE-family HTH domain
MSKISNMRLLRLQYSIALTELANAAGVSKQYLSGLELGEYAATENAIKLVQLAFERLIKTRAVRTRALKTAYSGSREQILEFAEDTDGH